MDGFQTDGAGTVEHVGDMVLAQSSGSENPGGSRMVIRVQDILSIIPRPPRTAGILTVAAPTRHIDVMTVRVVDGKLDTTVYHLGG